ncbi:hypothetical protein FB45DRAFT_915219 [Roridomyces roridus]|uniref:RNA polymerase II-associated protein 1 C-terminal domain-containing protein n=1 Tax=Roridomyces roridus TaxID=1738132 RepID=A0AAD7BUC2_9AGAR|nr:hypothetical protein FB45DRAFT_915219 [Roridomyces roridus]
MASLVGDVFERTPSSSKAASAFTKASAQTGFPQAPHRSKKSAFARAREAKAAPRGHVPVVGPSNAAERTRKRVVAMTEEEREEERRDILEKFGPGIGDLLQRVRDARSKAGHGAVTSLEEVNLQFREVHCFAIPNQIAQRKSGPLPPALSPVPSPASTRPTSRASRKLRFAEVLPDDVHVYESAPPSPRKKALALPPPTDDSDVVSLGTFASSSRATDEPVEGTPEDIRRRFFPSAPAHNADLAWMMEDVLPSASTERATLRFDLTGNPLAESLHSSLPTHLGLHHHAPDADGVQRAGYTLDDVFMTSRSGVKAQRAAGMRMLAGMARWAAAVRRGDVEPVDSVGNLSELKARILAAAVEALSERGNLGAHAIEVVWECIVGYAEVDETLNPDLGRDISGVELGATDLTVPLAHLLSQLTESTSELSSTASQTRILAILLRLARQTNEIATAIVSTPSLVSSLLRTFLLANSPSAPTDAALALDLLTTLAASTLNTADALLRFVAVLPPPTAAVLAGTLAFYATLASYGLYSHIAGTAQEPLARLSAYVQSPGTERSVRKAWAEVIAAWIVCAGHDILWSQVAAWRWGQDVLTLRDVLGVATAEWDVWTAIWSAEAAWLEGSRINGVRGGEAERQECLAVIRPGFEADGGKENTIVRAAMGALDAGLDRFERGGAPKLRAIGVYAETLTGAIRLWLACLPPVSDVPLAAPPFALPFSQLTKLCAKLVTHPLWSRVQKCGPGYVLFRPLASLLSIYLQLSQRLPDVSQDVWMAQALAILSRLLPGDEEFALTVAQQVFELLTPQWALSHGLNVAQAVWDKGGLAPIKPFLLGAIQPKFDVHIGPACLSPSSIQTATTLRLPAPLVAFSRRDFGLPISRDWTLSPLDHLLRSGTSTVFGNLPAGWDASEVDITRAALLLTEISRQLASRFSFAEFVLTQEEAVFGCMKVFMLEHAEEVFRDRVVGQLMDVLLAPFSEVAAGFLGTSTPFYQYYTDFVALYDAISFSHPTFARLLLPPTSMRYALDYRRHLWNDFSHILKTIRTNPEDMIAADLAEFMWPVESDPQMVAAYLGALIKVPLQGFPRILALHHVACNIWPDLRTGELAGNGDRAEKLLRVVVDQGGLEVITDVVRYQQKPAGPVRLPPDCFDLGADGRAARLTFIERVGGAVLSGRVEGLLK